MRSSIKIALLSTGIILGLTPAGHAQKKDAPKKAPIVAKGAMANGFMKLPSGLEYKIIKHGTGKKKPAVTDHIEMYIHVHVADSVMFDSRKMYGEKPVPYAIVAPKFKGDPVEGFMMMVAGDSAVFRIPVDSLKKTGNQLLPWMKMGQKIEYDVALVTVRTDAEEKKDAEEKSAAQKSIDDAKLQEYFKKNNLKPAKTASGLYYTISREGEGEKIQAGQSISVNYTGKLIDGKTFDSNEDSTFHHKEAFNLEVGKGRVIKGWDEGLQLLKKGSKATFYIPSGLAYGPQERNPIPANGILIFDVTITDVKMPVNEDKELQDYFTKNNIKATKTGSGMYYTIEKEGTGEKAKSGQKVTMNYIGHLLNKKEPFDANVNEDFTPKAGKAPFSFALGQHQVIAGWDEGVQLLKKGTKATFYLPSKLGYGERGAGAGIPPNSTLVFEVELVDMQ